MRKFLLLICFISLNITAFCAVDNQNLSLEQKEIFKAMQTEMTRNLKELKMDKFARPYFITYKIIPTTKYYFGANQGVLTRNTKVFYSDYEVQLRVGNKKEDNSFFVPTVRLTQTSDAPFALNYEGLRKSLWQITDGVYKEALSQLTEKQAYKKNKNITQEYSDFSFYPSQEHFDTLTPVNVDESYWQEVAKVTSAKGSYNELEEFKTVVTVIFKPSYFVSSTGSKYLQDNYVIDISFIAKGRLQDGFEFNLTKSLTYSDFKDVPSLDELGNLAQNFANEVLFLQKAKKVNSYIGPILLEGGQALNLMRVLQREISYTKPIFSNNEDYSIEGSFTNKIGLKVLSSGFDVIDDPLRKTFGNKKLAGYYEIDEEGVKAQKIQVIENGILKTLPYTSSLTKNNNKSNGHARVYFMSSGVFATPSNLILLPRKTINQEKFLDTFRSFCTEQGLESCPIIKARDGKIFYGVMVNAKSGKQEPVYGELTPFDTRNLRDIKYASDNMQVYNEISNQTGFSIITPDLILDNGEISPSKKEPARKALVSKP